VFLTHATVKNLDRVRSVKIGAIVDDHDAVGPVTLADMARGSDSGGALAFEDGHRVWLSGASSQRVINAVDGREIDAMAFAPYDVVSLHALTGVADVVQAGCDGGDTFLFDDGLQFADLQTLAWAPCSVRARSRGLLPEPAARPCVCH